MFKKGFTLAELLITIGLIGVVAALTLPTLMNEAQSKDIGPKLAKAASAFEQANLSLLSEQGVSSFINLGIVNKNDLIDELTNHIKMSKIDKYTSITLANVGVENENQSTACDYMKNRYNINNAKFYISKDGTVYIIDLGVDLNSPVYRTDFRYLKNPYLESMGKVVIDINGKTKPNRSGTDIFEFHWLFDGRLVPYGSHEASSNISGAKSCSWTALCPRNAYATDSRACAGHIFDNNLKAEYVY